MVQYNLPTALANDAMHATDGTTSIPAPYSALSEDYPGLILQKITPNQNTEDPTIWIVTCTYTTAAPQQMGTKPADVSKYNVDISGTFVPRDFEVSDDVSGNAIVNTANDLVTGITRTDYDEQISVSFHCRAPDWGTIDTCKGSVNSESITIIINGSARTLAALTVKVENINWALVYDADQAKTVRVDLILMYRKKETWVHKIPSMGFNKLDTAGNKTPITIGDVNVANGLAAGDRGDEFITNPVYLDETGAILPNGSAIVYINGTDGVHELDEVDFTTLLSEIST
jgi:hypothetical protein